MKRFELGKKNVEKRMNVIILEMKKTTRSLNENKNSVKTQKQLLSLVREYKRLYKTHLGFKCITEGLFSRPPESGRRLRIPFFSDTGKTPTKIIPRAKEAESGVVEKQAEISYLKDFLRNVQQVNSGNNLGDYVPTMMNLLDAAERDFSSVNDYDAAEKLGHVILFFKQYAELFGQNLRFANEENIYDLKTKQKIAKVLRNAFPNEMISVAGLAEDEDKILDNINLVTKLKPGGGRVGEILKKIDLSSSHKSVFSHMKDMLSSFGGGRAGFKTMFETYR